MKRSQKQTLSKVQETFSDHIMSTSKSYCSDDDEDNDDEEEDEDDDDKSG